MKGLSIKNKKDSKTAKLPMSGKVRKGFMLWCMVVMTMTVLMSMTMTAFAAGSDPLTVVNNLSNFMFGLIRAVGLILDRKSVV